MRENGRLYVVTNQRQYACLRKVACATQRGDAVRIDSRAEYRATSGLEGPQSAVGNVSYLFRTSMMSSSVGCSEGAVPFAGFAGATGDAPLARSVPTSVRFRFARDGDAGAGGGDGGVRVPLVVVAAIVKGTAFRDRRWGQRATRGGWPSRGGKTARSGG